MPADAESSCIASCTDSWHHWFGSLCGQAAGRTLRSSCCATNSLCCADKSTDPSSPTPTVACSARSRPRSRDRAETGGWSPPTRCCVSSGAASSGTGPNPSDRRADRRRQQRFADSHCASQPRIQPGDIAASTANLPGSATASLRPRSGEILNNARIRPRTHTLGSHLVAVPAVPGRRRLRLRHHRHRHAAQVLPAVLHRHRYPDRVLRRDHRPPQRRLGHPSRPEPVPPPRRRARWDACTRARPRQPIHSSIRRDLQNRRLRGPQNTSAHPRGEHVRRTLDRHPSTRAPRPHHHLEPTATQKARRRLHRSLQHAPAPPFTRPATTRRHQPTRPARQTPPSPENGPL